MVPDSQLTALLQHIATLYSQHDSAIARVAVASLNTAVHSPLVRLPQRIGQCDQLDPLLVEPSSASLAVLAQAQHILHWSDSGGAAKPAAVQSQLAFVELLGPSGMISHADCRVGLFLQGRHTAYPVHRHAAEELYLVLSGTACWQRGSQTPALLAPGTFVHHASWEAHAMTTVEDPLLAIWCWTGEIGFEHYEILT
jgi:dimethylpropiothetin dethiomethylase